MLTSVNQEWEDKLKEAFRKSTEEAALRMKLEHEVCSSFFAVAFFNENIRQVFREEQVAESAISDLATEWKLPVLRI